MHELIGNAIGAALLSRVAPNRQVCSKETADMECISWQLEGSFWLSAVMKGYKQLGVFMDFSQIQARMARPQKGLEGC